MIDRCQKLHGHERGFTLVELLVALAIIGLLTATVLVAMAGATEASRADRTRAQIARIHTLISEKWNAVESMRFDVSRFSNGLPAGPTSAIRRARYLVDARREYLRMTFPERITDVVDGLFINENRSAASSGHYAGLTNPPSDWLAYRRKAQRWIAAKRGSSANWENNWTQQNQGAECLYLILSQLHDGERAALEFFKDNEIGDTDDDGMPEILDSWGTPIVFYRWLPGFNIPAEFRDQVAGWNVGTSTAYSSVVPGSFQDVNTPDPFDPLELYTRWAYDIPRSKPEIMNSVVAELQSGNTNVHRTFMLFPVIISAGPDKQLDLNNRIGTAGSSAPVRYARMVPPNNPYIGTFSYKNMTDLAAGIRADTNGNGRDDFADNIHNHFIATGR